jgi:hypothetical protein
MLPLGDSWDGACLADPLSPAAPEPAARHSLCNLGYARHSCPRFPSTEAAAVDAVRFSLARDSGPSLHLRWSLELDHLPHAHGALDYSLSSGAFSPPPDALLLRHARAYVASYLRRRAAQPVEQ